MLRKASSMQYNPENVTKAQRQQAWDEVWDWLYEQAVESLRAKCAAAQAQEPTPIPIPLKRKRKPKKAA